jgi:hypothetical protein
VTGWRIRAQRAWWWTSYRAHLLLLSLLAGVRLVCFGLACLAHRWHTAVAAHGHVVADTVSATDYDDRIRPCNERYARMAFFLLHPDTTEETR